MGSDQRRMWPIKEGKKAEMVLNNKYHTISLSLDSKIYLNRNSSVYMGFYKKVGRKNKAKAKNKEEGLK